ncbi:MAG: hypothetical protein WC130_04470 [Kiritimatiellia bacterium]
MKKRKYGLMQLIVFVALLSWLAPIWSQAASFRPLLEQEQAHLGATHVATITYADFTETNTNTAVTLTNVFAVAAKQGVQLMAMQLKTAFTTGNTNYTGSVLVEVGDGTDADLYLTSTELASDGTEVWIKFGRSVQAATAAVSTNVTGVAAQTASYTNITGWTLQTQTMTDTNGVTALCITGLVATTQVQVPATNVAVTSAAQTRLSALTDDSTGRKVYTAVDTIDFVFTPNAEEALEALTAGEVLFYFKITP